MNGLRHGRGIWYSKKVDGDIYEGEYKNDKKSGIFFRKLIFIFN